MDISQMQELCDCIYVGLSFKESLAMIGVKEDQYHTIAADLGIRRVVEYARTKAKRDLLDQAHKVVNGEKTSLGSVQILKHILAARFGFSENRFELKQKARQHLDNIKQKDRALKQWADYQSAKMVAEGTNAQLDEWSKIS